MFKSTITFSSKELSAKERVKFKDLSDAMQLDEATQNSHVDIYPDFYVELHVENDKADTKEYDKLVIVDGDGNKWVTGSESFKRAFSDIAEEMGGESEPWGIRCFKKPSKNYKGKDFLTCTII